MDHVRVTRNPIDPCELTDLLTEPQSGAVVIYLGIVRGEEAGRPIKHLEFVVQPDIAQKELLEICHEIRTQWVTIRRVGFILRLGQVKAGEPMVAIGVAAPHRTEVFPALAFAVDRLKEVDSTWEREVSEKGEK